MASIQWNESLSVGIASIDRQHMKLVEMINDLDGAMRQGKGNDVIGGIISGMLSYTREHFSTEELLFEKHGYPETAAHMNEHVKFINEVSNFKTRFDARQLGLSISLINFLSDWLKNHIMGSDKAYSSFLRQHGAV